MPIPQGKNFLEILVKAKLFAEKDKKSDIAKGITNLLKNLKKLEDKALIRRGDGYSSFFKEIFDEVEDIKVRIGEQKKEIERLETALKEIEEQKEYMDSKIEAFDAVINSIRREQEEKFKEKSKKFTYKELVKRQVIAETEIDEAILKKLTFNIKQVEVGKFEIKGTVGEVMSLDLEDLLAAKENGQPTFEMGVLVLNVRPTLMVINKSFFSGKD